MPLTSNLFFFPSFFFFTPPFIVLNLLLKSYSVCLSTLHKIDDIQKLQPTDEGKEDFNSTGSDKSKDGADNLEDEEHDSLFYRDFM